MRIPFFSWLVDVCTDRVVDYAYMVHGRTRTAGNVMPDERIAISIGAVNDDLTRRCVTQVHRHGNDVWFDFGPGHTSLVVQADDPVINHVVLSGKARP